MKYQGGVWASMPKQVQSRAFYGALAHKGGWVVDVIIPALDEEESLPYVLDKLPFDVIRRVYVVDNGSKDATADVALEHGAHVVYEPQRGYGKACLAGIAAARLEPPDIVVFLDADYSDHPEELTRLVEPIVCDEVDIVIGSRTIGQREPGALLPQALFGNKLACVLLEIMSGYRCTDLGPFRAIRWDRLMDLDMVDEDFGWTVEMQIKAAQMHMSMVEVPVSYRKRTGVSKITGTLKGTAMASYKILFTLARYGLNFTS